MTVWFHSKEDRYMVIEFRRLFWYECWNFLAKILKLELRCTFLVIYVAAILWAVILRCICLFYINHISPKRKELYSYVHGNMIFLIHVLYPLFCCQSGLLYTRYALSYLPFLHLLPALHFSTSKDRGGVQTNLRESYRQLPSVENKHNETIEV